MSDARKDLAGHHVLLVVSGGIAAYKAAMLARALIRAGATVQALLTPAAATFVGPATFEGLTGRSVPADVFSPTDHAPHIHLAREADVAVFAPATANLLAKLAVGLADDLVTSTALMLDCPVVVAPAMHTEMWRHPATRENTSTLRGRGVHIVGPDEGELAVGDVGEGRLAEEDAIVAAVVTAVRGTDSSFEGRRVIVSAGGTREPIDPVRFIGNRSSGKMGYALAREAARRGAQVDLVAAPNNLDDPPGVRVHDVETAEQMRSAIVGLVDEADIVIKAAAVADFRPERYSASKIKKDSDELSTVTLVRNPDILAELGACKGGRVLVGFAAETDLAEDHGREKLHRKGLDLIVVNRVDMADAGFNVDTNQAVLLRADGGRREVPLTTKDRLAAVVCDEVSELLAQRRNA
ncbi:MAG TPA: bifunctional phosphopantothenoylcysteine decarboxylase/phosphopantothenate--cysteine ligase CoaBC [Euzebyales bacterium]